MYCANFVLGKMGCISSMRWRCAKDLCGKLILGEKVRRELMSMLSHFLGGSSEFGPLFLWVSRSLFRYKKTSHATQCAARFFI
jgi:hypothetical protein